MLRESRLPRRLVREQDGRLVDQGARESHPLLLASGKLHRLVPELVLEPQHRGELAATPEPDGAVLLPQVDALRQTQVAFHRQRREQVESLEDEADPPPSELRPLGVIELREIVPLDAHASRRGRQEPAERVEEGRLPTARRTHDGHELPAPDPKVDAA